MKSGKQSSCISSPWRGTCSQVTTAVHENGHTVMFPATEVVRTALGHIWGMKPTSTFRPQKWSVPRTAHGGRCGKWSKEGGKWQGGGLHNTGVNMLCWQAVLNRCTWTNEVLTASPFCSAWCFQHTKTTFRCCVDPNPSDHIRNFAVLLPGSIDGSLKWKLKVGFIF